MRLSEEDARERFGSARFAVLGTVRADEAPHLVPVTFAVEGDLIHTAVDHKPKTTTALRRLRNIAGEPRVTLLAQHAGEDWDRLWWVRVDGRASVSSDPDVMRHPIDLLVERYAQYSTRRPVGPVITIRADRWVGWAAAPMA